MKRIVLLCDGTLEDADSQQDTDLYTNIGKMSRALLEEDNRSNPPIEQIKYYQSGVGTEGSSLGGVVSGALGSGMMDKVRDLYDFLCLNWESGDEVLLVGFSRGAYTVRLLASLISIIGVLHPRRSMQLFPALFEALDDRTGQDPKHDAKVARRVQKLLSQFSADKKQQDLAYSGKGKFLIKAIGVFDTVGTRGRPSRLRLNTDDDSVRFDSFGFDETRLEPIVELAFQALALDEHRIDYMPVIWKRDLQIETKGQRLLQVWFEGAHADVGGGYKEQDLGFISLYWMIAQLQPSLAFDLDYLKKLVKPTTAPYGQMPPHKSRIGEFRMAKAVDRKVPAQLDRATNQYIHLSVRSQPASHLRDDVQAVLHVDALFPQLKPLEQTLEDFWPAPTRAPAKTPAPSPPTSAKPQDPPRALKSQQVASTSGAPAAAVHSDSDSDSALSGLPAPPKSTDSSRPPTPSSVTSFTDNGSPPPSPSSSDWPPLPVERPMGFHPFKAAGRRWKRMQEGLWQREQQRVR
ncbi:hypothetical protein JCM5296_000566 [Sporobolomyces johnsonii]